MTVESQAGDPLAGPQLVGALEVGGTHVTAALVDVGTCRILDPSRSRRPLDGSGSASTILGTLVDAASSVCTGDGPGMPLGVAIPGPFDYARGIARYEGVAKFETITGADVGAALRAGLRGAASRVAFLNDAVAFALGEWAAGAATGHDRVVGITLGTGVGSGFIDDGRVVDDDARVPPDGSVHLLTIGGQPLEDVVSRRALLRAAARIPGLPSGTDVRELAAMARVGDNAARAVFDEAFEALGRALAPWLARFEASVLVVGGSMTGSWDVVQPPLVRGVLAAEPRLAPMLVRRAERSEDSALIGAAVHASGAPAGVREGDTAARG
jgi:glucokinase